MLQIQYGKSLADELTSTDKKAISKDLFTLWTADKVNIKGQQYYLLVEKNTGLPILLTKLKADQFKKVLHEVVKNYDFITSQQQERVMQFFQDQQVKFIANNRSTTTKAFKRAKSDLEDNVDVLSQLVNIPHSAKSATVDDLVLLSLAYPSIDYEMGHNILTKMQEQVNDTLPIKPMDANLNSKINWQQWKDYEGKPKRGNAKIVKEVRDYNKKVVSKFLYQKNIELFSIGSALLSDFQDYYLLQKKILFVTSNLAASTSYIWLKVVSKRYSQMFLDDIFHCFIEFYNFLGEEGTIGKKDAKKTEKNLKYLYRQLSSNVAVPDGENSDPLESMELENKKQNDMVYEMQVQMCAFKPAMWRRFIINGSSTVEDLEIAILTMFRTEFGHMFDIYDSKIRQHFDNDHIDPENAKVSFFTKDDQLLLTYDYGDCWQFEIIIKKIYKSKKHLAHPRILAGHGYGIIDDIGGIDMLQEYYDTPDDEQDPDLLDWLGGKIDLDQFDMNELNKELAE